MPNPDKGNENAPSYVRGHVLLAKAAQAGAILFTLLALAIPVLLLSFISCSWPQAALALPAPGLVAYVQTLVRFLAAVCILACIVVFHAVTLSSFRTAPRALPSQPHTLPAVYSSGPALRHLLSLALTGAVQVPSFAVLCHGFTISRVIFSRVAPSWPDFQLLFLTGAIGGVAYSCMWHLHGGYVLRVSPRHEPWRLRVISDLAGTFNPASIVFAVSSASAGLLCLFVRVDDGTLTDPAVAAAAAMEGAASFAGDFSGLRRFWICCEAIALSIACWTLSSSIVRVLLTQPYDFVLESQASQPSPRGASGKFGSSGDSAKAKNDPAVLDSLLFALNAGVKMPTADPTGVLGSLALQDLCDKVSATPATRAPLFSDASGVVWHDILTACLNPLDRLSYRLWMRTNAHKIRSELPSIFQADTVESAALYQARQFGGGGGTGFDGGVVGGGGIVRASARVSDEALFGEIQRILHATKALSNLLVASRYEDRYGVVQRTLVDVMTSLLQCHEKVTALSGSQLLQTQSLLSSGARGGHDGSCRDGQFTVEEAHHVEKALVDAVRLIVDAFHNYLSGYLEAQEPRWAAKFNPRLAGFLNERS